MSLALREELALLPGPASRDGAPTWTLHDPVRNQFFRIDWPTFEVLARWSLGSPEAIAESISTATSLKLTATDVADVAKFLTDHQLVRQDSPEAPALLAQQKARQETGLLKRVIHHYLFFRIPLVHPDAWLTRHLPLAARFFTKTFALLTLVAAAAGLAGVARHWDAFVTTLIDTASMSGLASYAIAIVLVKTLHELGHAFTAKRQGCRVPAMGIAFLVMWPMPYTDTHDTWRLTDRYARLKVASAGILTELVIAAWATLAWVVLPEGSLRAAAFYLATLSWVATLTINASPFMRFDGYFILSDALDLPNLHNRSFALARWYLREVLFDLGEPRPEIFKPGLHRALIGFAWLTWLYRLVLFIGIAALVYHFFTKVLGVILFVIEIVWFILLPVKSELSAWWQRRHLIATRPAARRSLWVGVGLIVLACVPWPGRVAATGVLKPVETVPVFAPHGARLAALPFQDGATVRAGQVMMQFTHPDLDSRRDELAARLQKMRTLAAHAGLDNESRQRLLTTQAEAAAAQAELDNLDEQLAQFSPTAPYDGTLRMHEPDLAVGQWVSAREPLALLVRPGAQHVETFLDEDAVKRIEVGSRAHFAAHSGTDPIRALTVTHIDQDATRTLPSALYATQTGGSVLARERGQQLVPERATYRVILSVTEPDTVMPMALRGEVLIKAHGQSLGLRLLRQAAAVLVRESGL